MRQGRLPASPLEVGQGKLSRTKGDGPPLLAHGTGCHDACRKFDDWGPRTCGPACREFVDAQRARTGRDVVAFACVHCGGKHIRQRHEVVGLVGWVMWPESAQRSLFEGDSW